MVASNHLAQPASRARWLRLHPASAKRDEKMVAHFRGIFCAPWRQPVGLLRVETCKPEEVR
jgi:hypothetical protein